MEAVFAATPPLDLTPRDGDAAALAAAVGGRVLGGIVRLDRAGQVSALPGYAEGAFWVQDLAAALPARVLAPQQGERVLDLCAAPGGKTMQLAAAGARVTAVDISGPRMARLAENLARTGLAAELVTADALHWTGGPFDAVLVDAPCSATGTLRRHPDLAQALRQPDLAALTALQAGLVGHAAGLLAPGGRLVVATCSLLPQEGEALAAAIPAATGLTPDAGAVSAWPEWRSGAAGLRLRPDLLAAEGGMDGFFIAAFRRGRVPRGPKARPAMPPDG
jgi:16S rRNA (cytosine967-C5)-methyltransferase